ncbi:MAG: sulfite exporter TauE/SafE family protein, partial [Asticcacaulis sp.]|nr:sulfite exporter TauE/SafE family protein [Asticcacaulis sp.]
FAGAWLGRRLDGQVLLSLFALLMMAVAVLMLKNRGAGGNPAVRLNSDNVAKLIASGLGTGLLSGFFGIGGGFLIVPSLMAATAMPIVNAISSSLFAVTAFGVSTASSYALTGLVDWPIAGAFIAGGLAGGLAGSKAALRLGSHTTALTTGFAGLIFVVALYVLYKGISYLIA